MKVDAVFRGRFSTWDPARPSAFAIAVVNGRVVAFDDEAEALAGSARLREDFGSCAVFPGFHDAHCHTTAYGMALGELDLSSPPLERLEDLYVLVAKAAAGLAAGEWLVGGGYDQNKLGGHPELDRLDSAAPDRPVWLKHTSGHMCALNSAALRAIGPRLDERVEGGLVVRDESGRPTGLLQERAQSLVGDLVLPRSMESLAGAIDRAHASYVTEGITSVCDAGVAGGWIGQSPAEFAAYQLAKETGRTRVRTCVMLASDVLEPLSGHVDDAMEGALGLPGGLRSGLGDDWLSLGPVKVFADGSLIGRTCWMREGFEDDPANTGYPQKEPDELQAAIVGAHLAGWQVATHAIGDAAVSFVLDCYEEALRRRPRADHRHRIEHCGITTPADLRRIVSLGVVPVPQGRFVGEIGDGMLSALGGGRALDAYRLRSFLDAGVPLPASSDRPVVDGRPLLGIGDMALRRTAAGSKFGPSEAITVDQALRAYSAGSAYAERAERDRGSLGLGQLADFVVLADDPRSTPAGDIGEIPVMATLIGGSFAYDAR